MSLGIYLFIYFCLYYIKLCHQRPAEFALYPRLISVMLVVNCEYYYESAEANLPAKPGTKVDKYGASQLSKMPRHAHGVPA